MATILYPYIKIVHPLSSISNSEILVGLAGLLGGLQSTSPTRAAMEHRRIELLLAEAMVAMEVPEHA